MTDLHHPRTAGEAVHRDLIEREAAIAAVSATAIKWGVSGEPAILIATKDAIRALPAAQDGAEVERLRAENERNAGIAINAIEQGRAWKVRAEAAEAENAALKAEAERLRAERNIADQALVDRYRDPKSGKFDFPGDVAKIVRALDERDAENDVLKADNERLRAALVDMVPDEVACKENGRRSCLIDHPVSVLRAARAALRAHEQGGA